MQYISSIHPYYIEFKNWTFYIHNFHDFFRYSISIVAKIRFITKCFMCCFHINPRMMATITSFYTAYTTVTDLSHSTQLTFRYYCYRPFTFYTAYIPVLVTYLSHFTQLTFQYYCYIPVTFYTAYIPLLLLHTCHILHSLHSSITVTYLSHSTQHTFQYYCYIPVTFYTVYITVLLLHTCHILHSLHSSITVTYLSQSNYNVFWSFKHMTSHTRTLLLPKHVYIYVKKNVPVHETGLFLPAAQIWCQAYPFSFPQ